MALAPKLTIPTGYEAQQRQLERKRKLAEAMMSMGMQNNPNMVSPLQGLGQLAQIIAGKALDKRLEKRHGELDARILEDFGKANTEFNEDLDTGDWGAVLKKYSSNPMLADRLKPVENLWEAGKRQDQEIVQNGGRWDRKGGLVGTAVPSKPQDDLIVGADGTVSINPVKLTRDMMSQGLEVTNPVTSMQWPGAAGQPPAMGAAAPQAPGGLPPISPQGLASMANGGQGLIAPEDAAALHQRMGPEGFANWMKTTGQHIGKLVDGKPFYQINGKWYDNPEGR